MAKKNTNPHGSINRSLRESIAFAHSLVKSSSMPFLDPENPKSGYAYARKGHPLVDEAEKFIACAEGMPAQNAIAYHSGLAALKQLVQALCFGEAGCNKRIVTAHNIYGGSHHQLMEWRDRFGLDIRFVKNPLKLSSWDEEIRCKPAVVYFETPTNPMLDVLPISAIAKLCHEYGTILVVDNTLGVKLQWPLALGADAVLHSVTKYLIGNSSGLGGALVGTAEFIKKYGRVLRKDRECDGSIMSGASADAVIENSLTQEHMLKCSYNALALAEFLEEHPQVLRVNYPSLSSNRGYALAKEQMKGGSGVLSFEVSNFEIATQVVEALKKVILTAHLGDLHNYLVVIPLVTTHSALSPEELAYAGIRGGLIRVSVGLGSVLPIIEDFDQALDKVHGKKKRGLLHNLDLSFPTVPEAEEHRSMLRGLKHMRRSRKSRLRKK